MRRGRRATPSAPCVLRQAPISFLTRSARRVGRPLVSSLLSALAIICSARLMPIAAQGLGLPERRLVAHPGQRRELGLRAGDEVAQGAPGEVRRGDAVTDVAARPGAAGRAVEADRGVPVARHADRPAPAVGDAELADLREEGVDELPQVLVHGVVHDVGLVELGVVVIGRPAAADGDATVLGAAGVEDQVAHVAEDLVLLPPEALPGLVGERLGGDQSVSRAARGGARSRGARG